MRSKILIPCLGFALISLASAQTPDPGVSQADLSKFKLLAAPRPRPVLKKGDRLAICGDSITEQRMYSRLMEDYLTMCVPQLEVTVRQYGWSGERAPGFLARMTNDCLRFKPTVATTCYGMNDHEYRSYEDRIGLTYSNSTTAIVDAFKAHGARVVLGSAGCVGKVPSWGHRENTILDLNLNLCKLRNIDIQIAKKERVAFADVFWPMLTAGVTARNEYGTNYGIAGADGVHPQWAGHTVMAYAFLKGLGLDGNIGTFTVDLNRNRMRVSAGHELLSSTGGTYEIKSSRYPFCACVSAESEPGSVRPPYPVCGSDDISSDKSIRSGMTFVPFEQDLNRLALVAKGGKASSYKVTWGDQSKKFSADQLAKGINLAQEFPQNPFCAAFAKVDAAVAAKQAYETRQIKTIFRSVEARTDMEGVAARTERERAPLAAAIKDAFVPVTHTLSITPM